MSTLYSSSVPLTQHGHLRLPVPTVWKPQIAHGFWSALGAQSTYAPKNLEPYFEYFAEQCRLYETLGRKLPFSDYYGIIQIANDIKNGLDRSRVYQQLEDRCRNSATTSATLPSVDVLNDAIDLTARLLLMMDVGTPSSRMWTGRASRVWHNGSIQAFLAVVFQHQTMNRHDGIHLDRDFNARNLYAIGGLKVELTNNLLDHLEVVDIEGETTVMIFHHATFLRNQEHLYFPDGMIDETLQTIALLFPQNRWFRRTKLWHRKLEVQDADPSVLTCEATQRTTEIENYKYWHDRLVRLKLIYDQAKPRTARQWWNDRREGTQWYALWVVLGFTVFFGLVQSIEGAIQVYKSYH